MGTRRKSSRPRRDRDVETETTTLSRPVVWYWYAKKLFYRSFDSISGKIGHAASEYVVAELLKTKCLPVLLYGLEVCTLCKAQIR